MEFSEQQDREEIVALGVSLFERGYAVGSAGNISVRIADGYLMTPTNACLGRLTAERISRLDQDWRHVDGDPPSKEVFMHRAMMRARPNAGAVVHLHSTFATAISCLPPVDGMAPIPVLTPYFVMRTGGRVPVVRYWPPGDSGMEPEVERAAHLSSVVVLANHGTVVAGNTLVDAVGTAEEFEETARLCLLLRNHAPVLLTESQIDELLVRFGSS